MTVKVTLEYCRDAGTTTSSGRVTSNENGLVTEEGLPFARVEFKDMLEQLSRILGTWPLEQDVDVDIQRTDREGLKPYSLDVATVALLRTDPEAALQSMGAGDASPLRVIEQVQAARTPRVAPPIRAGHDTLADGFGEVVYFRVRGHELECPCCGYWGMFTSPGLLNDSSRAGAVFKTVFVCPKKCRSRIAVTCLGEWGYVEVTYLLDKTKLDAFYLPRAWNEGKAWVSRESLLQKLNEFRTEKEKLCSTATTAV